MIHVAIRARGTFVIFALCCAETLKAWVLKMYLTLLLSRYHIMLVVVLLIR